MPQAPQFDADSLKLAASYDVLLPDLDPTPRYVDGVNMFVTGKSKLAKRPGSQSTNSPSIAGRVDRCVMCESLDTPSHLYMIISVWNGTTWTAYYQDLDSFFPTWTSLGTLRDVNASTRPHEITVSRGMAYVKGYPGPGGDKLGTVVFNPNGGSPYVTFWGLLGPTAPAALSSAGGWATSDHTVVVNLGWGYTYAYKTRTGAVSNRAPLQTNPELAPSVTAPFTGKRPSMTLAGHADTANVPTICVYRTTDGGGSFYKLKEITNTGGAITFEDNGLASGVGSNVFHDPMPDQYLDTSAVSPSLTSNSPMPTVLADLGKVVGVDTPMASTPTESYAARLWVGIGNVLFFSAQEELHEGVPEETWPSGGLGNFFRFQHPIVNLKATTEALYVFTTEQTYWVRGTSRETLQALPLFADLGARPDMPRAVTTADKSVIWLTHDMRICIARGGQRDFLSDGLGRTLKTYLDERFFDVVGGEELVLQRYAEYDHDWLIVAGVNSQQPQLSRQWIFDFNQGERGVWSLPWTMRATAVLGARTNLPFGDKGRKLFWFTYDAATVQAGLVQTDMTQQRAVDYVWGIGDLPYAASFRLSLSGNPTGNHINSLRAPAMTSVIYGIKLERTSFTGDSDPTLTYYLDSTATTGGVSGGPALTPPRRNPSVGYVTHQWNINQACERIGITVAKPANAERFEVQTLDYIWTPDGGA